MQENKDIQEAAAEDINSTEAAEETDTPETVAEETDTPEVIAAETDVPEADAPQAEKHGFLPRKGVFRLKKKMKFYEVTAEDDITFRGFLSYRHLKMLAWLLIVIACLGAALGIYATVTEQTDSYKRIISIMEGGKDLAVPLLLIASFATILNGRGNYKRVIIINAALALGLVVLFALIYERYIVRGGTAILGGREQFSSFMDTWLSEADSTGYFSFNIFIDLTMCTLVMFFINYNPKKYFQGIKIYLFRGMVLLPIAYEVISLCLKILASTHTVTLPVYVFPFLTTKPPASFLLFLFIARYFKSIEHSFIRHGKTHEDYEAYLKTNHNSFRFSRILIISIIIFIVIDVVMMGFVGALHIANEGKLNTQDETTLKEAVNIAQLWGFGKTLPMILITPLLLFFSYTKTHKNMLIDILIPVAGVAVIFLVYFDGFFTAFCEVVKRGM